jgi:predicted nucleic acid-binding protein
MLKIYLDTCCYNRPYDDQEQDIVKKEAKIIDDIEHLVRNEQIDLVSSFILRYEIDRNPSFIIRKKINSFISCATEFVSAEYINTINQMSLPIIKTGVKQTDALHVACALFSQCDYFLTTDKRVLKYTSKDIIITDPITFYNIWGDYHGND